MIIIEASLFSVSTKSFAGHRKPIGTATNNSTVTTANTRSARLHFFQSAKKSRIVLPSAATRRVGRSSGESC